MKNLKVDFKKLHKVCDILNELYGKYSQEDDYIKYNFHLVGIDFKVPYCYDLEDFIDFNAFSLNKFHESITIHPADEYYDEQSIPLILLNKNKKEIEEWYKEKLIELKEADKKRNLREIERIKSDIERLQRDLKSLTEEE